MQIREATIHDAAALAHLISLANKEVATRFDLNANNCPKHPSFCTEAWVQADFTRGERYFILENESSALGCVAYEQAKAEIAYLNRLSVLPEQQRKGIGSRLVEHIVQLAKPQEPRPSVSVLSVNTLNCNTGIESAVFRPEKPGTLATCHFP